MKTKQFKIGEYAIGGILSATINAEDITLKALDWDTKAVVSPLHEQTSDDYHTLMDILLDWTSYYYAEQVMDWLKANAPHILGEAR